MSSPEVNKWWILITPTGEELVFENFEELKTAVESPSTIEDLRRKSEPALKLSMPELAQDLQSVAPAAPEEPVAGPVIPRPAPTGMTASKEAPVEEVPVKDAPVKEEAPVKDAATEEEAPTSDEAPISLSDISLAASEVKMPSLPPGVARPSGPPAARAASRPPPPVPTRKSAVPPPMPVSGSKPPTSKPPPQHRSAAWEHDDASVPKLPAGGTPLPLPVAKPAAAKPAAPPPARPRPPPRAQVEELEVEPDPSVRIPSLPAPAVAAPPSSSRGWMIGAALIAAGTVAYVWSPSRDKQPQVPPTVSAEPSTTAAPASPEGSLADFDAAITDGDLDRASLLADKLGAMAEKDPRVLVRQARVAVIKADRAWLAARLVTTDAGAAAPSAALADLTKNAVTLSEAALAVAPDDMQAILARIDALRIAGNLDGTEPLVVQVLAKRTDPDVAYTLGARDFVSAKPALVPGPPPGLVDLQLASATNPRLARPQALLAYLLAERGELDAAREMAKGLETPAHPNPLLEPLRAYIASRPVPTSTNTPPATTNRTTSYVTAPLTAPPPASADTATAPDEPAAPVVPMTAPGLTALGDAARAKGDRGAAQTFYSRALALNPNHYPAMLGLADIEWETGARSKAIARYTQIKERFPNAPPRVAERLSQ